MRTTRHRCGVFLAAVVPTTLGLFTMLSLPVYAMRVQAPSHEPGSIGAYRASSEQSKKEEFDAAMNRAVGSLVTALRSSVFKGTPKSTDKIATDAARADRLEALARNFDSSKMASVFVDASPDIQLV